MSYIGLLQHRGDVVRMTESFVNGVPVVQWTVVRTNVRLFADLNFVRLGKDPTWTPEAGRPTTRTGVGFFLKNAPVMPGDRIRITRGPRGTFSIEGAVDEAWQPMGRHHLEVSLKEVPNQLDAAGQATEDYSQFDGSAPGD